MFGSWLQRVGALSTLALALFAAPTAHAATGKCDVSGGVDYTQFTAAYPGVDPYTMDTSVTGNSAARCMKTIRSLGQVVEGVFRDGKGRYADELGTFGQLFNMYPGEQFTAAGCSPGVHLKPGRNNPAGYSCSPGGDGSFAAVAASVNKLDWNWTQGPRYNPAARVWCTDPSNGCFGGRCYDHDCVLPNGTLKACGAGEICVKGGACVAGDPATLGTCTPLNVKPGVADGDGSFYNPWDALVFDLGGLANKVAIFATNDHGPQPCESNEYTVFLTNNPYSRELVNNPEKDGANPNKWNRAKLHKIFTHGWIDNPSCCDSPKNCDASCTLPLPGDAPVLEADSMVTVFTLPCGISFRYVATISGYDGRSLEDPTKVDDCEFHSSENEVDAVAGLNDDESAICPDKDGDGFPSCSCNPAPNPCDCNDDPAVDPNAAKYFPGAPADCDGPQYGCAPVTCPTGKTCHDHQCLSACGGGEYKCAPGFTCKTVTPTGGGGETALCLASACGDAGACAAGFTCKDGACIDLCATVKCPYGQRCQGGTCVDPCLLISCPAGQHCQGGICADSCACLAKDATGYPCGGALPVCDTTKGTCVADGCTETTCPTGQHCEGSEAGPVCKGACEGVICPGKQVCDDVKGCVDKCALLTTPCDTGKACKDGVCIDATCLNVECNAPFVCQAGKCVDPGASELCFACDSGSTQPLPDASVPVDASTGDAGVGVETGLVADEPTKEQGGCGCHTPSSAPAQTLAGLVGAAVAITLVASRRRRR